MQAPNKTKSIKPTAGQSEKALLEENRAALREIAASPDEPRCLAMLMMMLDGKGNGKIKYLGGLLMNANERAATLVICSYPKIFLNDPVNRLFGHNIVSGATKIERRGCKGLGEYNIVKGEGPSPNYATIQIAPEYIGAWRRVFSTPERKERLKTADNADYLLKEFVPDLQKQVEEMVCHPKRKTSV